MFIAQVLVGSSKQLKQILVIQIEHNIDKNPDWPEATSWLFTSVAKDLNLGATKNQIQVMVRVGI